MVDTKDDSDNIRLLAVWYSVRSRDPSLHEVANATSGNHDPGGALNRVCPGAVWPRAGIRVSLPGRECFCLASEAAPGSLNRCPCCALHHAIRRSWLRRPGFAVRRAKHVFFERPCPPNTVHDLPFGARLHPPPSVLGGLDRIQEGLRAAPQSEAHGCPTRAEPGAPGMKRRTSAISLQPASLTTRQASRARTMAPPF